MILNLLGFIGLLLCLS